MITNTTPMPSLGTHYQEQHTQTPGHTEQSSMYNYRCRQIHKDHTITQEVKPRPNTNNNLKLGIKNQMNIHLISSLHYNRLK